MRINSSSNLLPGLRKGQEAVQDTRENLPAHLPLHTTLSWQQLRCNNQVQADVGPAPWDEDHLLCSYIVPQADREMTLALLMLFSSDISRRVEFIPVWPSHAGDGRTWLSCHVL